MSDVYYKTQTGSLFISQGRIPPVGAVEITEEEANELAAELDVPFYIHGDNFPVLSDTSTMGGGQGVADVENERAVTIASLEERIRDLEKQLEQA